MRIEELLGKPMEKCLGCFVDFLSHIEYLNGAKHKHDHK